MHNVAVAGFDKDLDVSVCIYSPPNPLPAPPRFGSRTATADKLTKPSGDFRLCKSSWCNCAPKSMYSLFLSVFNRQHCAQRKVPVI